MVIALLTSWILTATPPPTGTSLDERLPLPPPPVLRTDKPAEAPPVSHAPSSSPLTGLLPTVVLLAAMGGALFWLKRREVHTPRYLRVVERVSFGPRRSVVVTQLGEELLIFGSAETGMSLLASRPVPATPLKAEAPVTPAAPSFQEALDKETTEDEELRRKLQMGMRAKVAS